MVTHQRRGGSSHRLYIFVVRVIALLERRAWIAMRHPLCFRFREWNEPAQQPTRLPLQGTCCGHVPPGVSAEWRGQKRGLDARDFVAISVDLDDELRQRALDRRRRGERAGGVLIVEALAQRIIEKRTLHR